jgi:hypothetical protein
MTPSWDSEIKSAKRFSGDSMYTLLVPPSDDTPLGTASQRILIRLGLFAAHVVGTLPRSQEHTPSG